MADLNKRIAELEARVAKYEAELDTTTAEEKQRIPGLIISRTETLNRERRRILEVNYFAQNL